MTTAATSSSSAGGAADLGDWYTFTVLLDELDVRTAMAYLADKRASSGGVVTRAELLEVDGPMLRYGLKEMHDCRLHLPRRTAELPDQEALAQRWATFHAALSEGRLAPAR